jgi:hypothetical protein
MLIANRRTESGTTPQLDAFDGGTRRSMQPGADPAEASLQDRRIPGGMPDTGCTSGLTSNLRKAQFLCLRSVRHTTFSLRRGFGKVPIVIADSFDNYLTPFCVSSLAFPNNSRLSRGESIYGCAGVALSCFQRRRGRVWLIRRSRKVLGLGDPSPQLNRWDAA